MYAFTRKSVIEVQFAMPATKHASASDLFHRQPAIQYWIFNSLLAAASFSKGH